jgi:cytochrome c oxidase subunit 2
MPNNFPLWPEQASTMAAHVDALYIFLLLVTGAMALLVFTLVIFFAARYRHRPGVRAEQIVGSNALEITWSALPVPPTPLKFTWSLNSGCGRWNTPKVSARSTNFMSPWDAT